MDLGGGGVGARAAPPSSQSNFFHCHAVFGRNYAK